MYHFNLLPVPQQKQTKRWIIFTHISNGVVLLNGILLLTAGLLFSSSMVLNDRLADANAEAASEIERASSTDRLVQDVQGLNTRISGLTGIQRHHPNHLALISSVTSLLPQSISLTELSVSFEDTSVRLAGIAENRDALQALQQAVEADQRFALSTFPFEEFTQPDNIPFIMTLAFDLNNFEY